ncbi:hypothetical protein ACFPOA_14375 [Lysobacter niabensis]|uniref:hypothetical protein n=1 Tax=Agrilutibacter niabensis TaxID=380628 RepID=UPI0036137E1A
MKLRPLIAACLLASAPALAGGPATTGALATPANRIAGIWSNVANVGPCGGSPVETNRQTLAFGAGGSFLDNPRFPPAGVPNIAGIAGTHTRSFGIGSWTFNPTTGVYTLDQRFDWYVNGLYHGYQVVRRTILLSNDGNQGAGPVQTARFDAAGAMLLQLCGSAVMTRVS